MDSTKVLLFLKFLWENVFPVVVIGFVIIGSFWQLWEVLISRDQE